MLLAPSLVSVIEREERDDGASADTEEEVVVALPGRDVVGARGSEDGRAHVHYHPLYVPRWSRSIRRLPSIHSFLHHDFVIGAVAIGFAGDATRGCNQADG